MKLRLAGTLLLCGFCLPYAIRAQQVDPNLIREVFAVRAEVASSLAALQHYTWNAITEISVKGDVKSSNAYTCRYDQNGQLIRTLAEKGKEMEPANGVSKRPRVRGKAEMQDYIDRAISRIYRYVPPDPEQMSLLLKNGNVSLGPSTASTSEIRFTNYFEQGDTLVFTYDSASKTLLRARVTSSLGSPKDPLTLEANFEKLPDGVNHVSSATLNATAKKVQVTVKNVLYTKVAD